MFGVPALRSEDPRFLRGQGRYLENIPIEGALRAMFVRSIMPHARLLGVDLDAARDAPGVVAVYTADDLDAAADAAERQRRGGERDPRGRRSAARCSRATRCGSSGNRSR